MSEHEALRRMIAEFEQLAGSALSNPLLPKNAARALVLMPQMMNMLLQSHINLQKLIEEKTGL